MIKIALSMWRISGSAEVRPSREYQPDSLIPRFIMQVRLEKRPSIKIRANQVHRNGNHGPEPGLLRRPGRKMRAGPRVNSPAARTFRTAVGRPGPGRVGRGLDGARR